MRRDDETAKGNDEQEQAGFGFIIDYTPMSNQPRAGLERLSLRGQIAALES